MQRREFINAMAPGAASLGLTPAAAAAERPNIIMILADDLGYGDLGCYGQKLIKTPNLDRMAAEGLRFTQFYSGNTVCAPSRCVLMTGQHMGHCHVRGNAETDMLVQSLRQSDVTVAEVLKSAGYATALIGKWGLGEIDQPGHPLRKGFDTFYGYLNQVHAHNYWPDFLWRNREQVKLPNVVKPAERAYGGFRGGVSTKRVQYSPDLIANEALAWIEKQKNNSFFLYLAPTLPHANNEWTSGIGHGAEIPDYGIYAKQNWPDPDKGQAAMVSRLDRDVGRVLDRLASLGLTEKTLVLFTSDNGPHMESGNNPPLFNPAGPLRGMKRDLLEGGIRVPFLASWPGRIQPGQVSDHVGYFGDLMATVCDLTGSALPPNRDSVSFLPALRGERTRQRQHDYLYWEFYEGGSAQAVRWGKWKGIRSPMFTGTIQLYDLSFDPGEKYNVARGHADVVKQIEAIMARAHTPHPNWKTGDSPRVSTPRKP